MGGSMPSEQASASAVDYGARRADGSGASRSPVERDARTQRARREALVISSTLDDRAAFDARLAAGTPRVRPDDAAGQAALRQCLATGASSAECAAQVEASLDSRGFFCTQTLRITAGGKVCGADESISPAKAAALLKEAEAKAGPRASSTPLIVGSVIACGVLAWLVLR